MNRLELCEVVDAELEPVWFLGDQEKHRFRECYLQQNTVESVCVKLKLDPLLVQLLYYRLSITLSDQALRGCNQS